MDGLIFGDDSSDYQKTIDKIIELKSQRSYLIQTNISENNLEVAATIKLREQIQILRDAARDLYRTVGDSAYEFVGDDRYLSGTISNQATPGEYEIKILDLAKPQVISVEGVDPKITLPSGVIQLKVNEELLELSFDGGGPNKLVRLINDEAGHQLKASWFRKNHKGNIFILKSKKAGRLSEIKLIKDPAKILHQLGLYKDNPNLDYKNKVLIDNQDLVISNVSLPQLQDTANTINIALSNQIVNWKKELISQLAMKMSSLTSEDLGVSKMTNTTNQANALTVVGETESPAIPTVVESNQFKFTSSGVTVTLNKKVDFSEMESIFFSYFWSSLELEKLKSEVIALVRQSTLETPVDLSTNVIFQPLTNSSLTNEINQTNFNNKFNQFVAEQLKVELHYEIRGVNKSFVLKPIIEKSSEKIGRRIRFNSAKLGERIDRLNLVELKLSFPNYPLLDAVLSPSVGSIKYDEWYKPEDRYLSQNELQKAQGAKFVYESIELGRDGNEVSDIIDGLVLNLKKPSDGPVQFEVKVNANSIEERMVSFIGEYNRTIEYLNIFIAKDLKELGVDKLSEEMADKVGVLQRQFWLRRMKNRLRNIMIAPYTIDYKQGTILLQKFGVENNYNLAQPTHIDADKLKFDEVKFAKEIAKKGNDYRSVFSYDSNDDVIPDNGFAWKISEFTTELLSPNSFLRTFVRSRETENKRLNSNLDREKERIDNQRSKLVEDFGQVEALKQEQEQFKGFLEGLGGNK